MFDTTFESADLFTQDEFADWVARLPPSDVHHYELMSGRIVKNPPAGYPQGASGPLVAYRIGGFVIERRLGMSFSAEQGFALPSGDTVAPDFAVVLRERWPTEPPLARGDFLAIVPDLVVEILSPSTARYDRGEKRTIYERNGVREYWILDPRGRRLTIFALCEGRYGKGTTYEEPQFARSEVLPGLEVEVSTLLP